MSRVISAWSQVPKRRPVVSESTVAPDEMLPEYDFRGGVRGKYAAQYAEGSNVVLLDPDVAAVFPDASAVNTALRALADIARRQANGHLPAP
ncbi:MAG: hypothetical protein LH467_12660, partial [Gemmatimonadaceae bacterium]|nr:hypothetical protein [Gemmatimonadaceae bacterium]